MKTTVAQWDLADALQKLQSIAPVKSPVQAYQNVLLEATEKGLYCTATNGEITTKVFVAGLLEEAGKISVNCRKLAAFVKSLDDEQVNLQATSSDRLQILSDNGKYTFPGLSADEFPVMPVSDEATFTIPSGNLKSALIDTDFAASTDEVRYVLNGVCFTFKEDKIEFAACDSKQVAVATYHTEVGKELDQIVVPLRACQEIKKVFTEDEDISVAVEDTYLVFFTDTYEFSTRKIDLSGGSFPNYWQFIVTDDKDVVLANKSQLQKAVSRISLFTQDDSYGIDLVVNEEEGVLDVKAQGQSYDGHESVDISGKTANLDFRVNSKFLFGILQRLNCEDIMISMSPDKTRIALKCPDNEDQLYTLALVTR